ncbi:CCA tRNA nucleotidyltransferase, partial [hydrothermal vent metagenome]
MAAVVQRWTSTQARNAATAIVRTLRGKGHTAYFAGGCVRDALLGAEPVDFDVATSARPEQVQALFRQTAAVGASFGVVLVKERGVMVEVATFRSDGPYSDKRRPDHVEFADAEHDAQRRDFTINALFLDPLAGDAEKSPVCAQKSCPPSPGLQSGGASEEHRADQTDRPPTEVGGSEMEGASGIIDFVGGLDDLRAGCIRAVGDPAQRLAEDHLRALRAVRFAARYGFEIEPRTAAAIRAHATDLAGVSCERIGEEFRRMMAHPSRAQAAELLGELGLDGVLLGEGGDKSNEGSVLAALQSPGLQSGGAPAKSRGDQTNRPPTEVGGSEVG